MLVCSRFTRLEEESPYPLWSRGPDFICHYTSQASCLVHLTIYSSQVFSKQTQNVHKKQVDEDLRITNPVEQHSGGGKCIIKNKKRMERRPIIGET